MKPALKKLHTKTSLKKLILKSNPKKTEIENQPEKVEFENQPEKIGNENQPEKVKMKTSLKNGNENHPEKVKMKTSLKMLRSKATTKSWNCKRADIFLFFKNNFEGSPLQSCELPSKGLLAPPQRENGSQIDCCRNPGEVDLLILIRFFKDNLFFLSSCYCTVGMGKTF